MKKLIRITTIPLSITKLLGNQLRFMSAHFDVTLVSSDPESLKIAAEREGVAYSAVEFTRRITPLADLVSLFKLIFFLRKEKPHIVHTHTPKAGIIGMLASYICGVPIRLHTVAGLPLMEEFGFKKKLLVAVEKIAYSCATMIYPNSHRLREYILENKLCTATKVKVIGNGSSNGIDTSFFIRSEEVRKDAERLLRTNSIEDSEFVFLFIGRLVRDKGIEELVDAFIEFNSLHPNSKLLLVGPQEPELDPLSSKAINQIESTSAILEFGFQNDVRPFLYMSHVLVFPSYREGFPNVPMQAGCFDLPSIVTDINGCNEIIVDKLNGLIIPVKNRDSLFNAMITTYENKELFHFMAKNARKMIVERFEQHTLWTLLLDEYKIQLKSNGL